MRHFLVTRAVDLGLKRIDVYDDQAAALRAYEAAEKRQIRRKVPDEVCLFGAPNLATLLATHPGWFDAPANDGVLELVGEALGVRRTR